MSKINKAAVLNPFNELTANILNYIPRATTTEFGIVAIGSGINVDALGRIYLDTQEYSDRLSAIEAQAASALATQKSEVAAAIAQVNLTQSQTITALTLEVNNLKTNLTDSITATQTDLINRADQLAQDVTDITVQLTQDKAAFTQEIQDALVYLEQAESVASALRTPRKIQTVPFDGRQDINLPVFTSEIDGLVPKRVGATTTKYLREDGGWVVPPNTTYPLLTQTNAEAGTSTTANTISAQVLKDAILHHTPVVTDITGNAGTATKLQTPRTIGGVSFDGTANINLAGVNIAGNQNTSGNATTATKLATARTINGVSFDGSANITLPLASTSVSGTVQLNNTLTSTATGYALTAAQGKVLNDIKLDKTANAISASKLQTSRTISLSGGVTGSVSFDGSANASITTAITGLGAANGIATLDSNGQVPSTQLPSYVDDVLEYANVAAFPTTGVAGKIYVETTGNTTYRWGGTTYVKITSGEVSSVAGKTGVVTLTKADVGLDQVDNTPDAQKPISEATQLALNDKVNKSDVIGVAKGGTGGTTAAEARANIQVPACKLLDGVDFNSVVESGLYFITTIGSLNAPVANVWGYLEVVAAPGLGERLLQKFTPDNTNGSETHTRCLYSGSWGAWQLDQSVPLNRIEFGTANTGIRSPNTSAVISISDDGTPYLYRGSAPTDPTWGVNYGGTGAKTVIGARNNLGIFYAHGLQGSYDNGNIPWNETSGVYSSSYNGASDAVVHFLAGGTSAAALQLKVGYTNGGLSFRSARDAVGFERAWDYIYSTHNVALDGNGYLKMASPVVDLYADHIEPNTQAQEQNVTFEKLGVGDYLLKGTLGFAQTNWYVEQPKDANGNVFHAIVYDTLDSGDISIKTYERKLDGLNIVADLTKPVDIKENRFISIRLHEEPETPTSPEINPDLLDNEGKAAPSAYHTLEKGVWTITDEYAAVLEQRRLSNMKPLKRRQFRLTLAMNGYDLKEVESLIDGIEDPMQRTIAQIEWQDATDFERTNPTLLMMAELMQLTTEQIDQLWSYGLAL